MLFNFWKRQKWVKNGCFVEIRWWVRETFVGENDVLRLYLSIKKYRFCSVCCTRFWLKSVSFLFLNNVKWFRQEINAYGDLLQNERHVLKHVSSLQNEKKFLKHISSLQNETRRVYKNNRKHFFERFSSLKNKKHVFEA